MGGVTDSIESAVFGTLGRVMARTQERRKLPVDLLESDDAYLAIFDAPGALSSDMNIRFEDNTIYLRIDRFRDSNEEYAMKYPGRGLALNGSVALPPEAMVAADSASATLKDDGTIHVRVPKVGDDEHDGGEETADPS